MPRTFSYTNHSHSVPITLILQFFAKFFTDPNRSANHQFVTCSPYVFDDYDILLHYISFFFFHSNVMCAVSSSHLAHIGVYQFALHLVRSFSFACEHASTNTRTHAHHIKIYPNHQSHPMTTWTHYTDTSTPHHFFRSVFFFCNHFN